MTKTRTQSLTWLDLFTGGCPNPDCDSSSFHMSSPCEGIHRMELTPTFDDEERLADVQAVGVWDEHTDMGEGTIVCSLCDLKLDVDQTEVTYR